MTEAKASLLMGSAKHAAGRHVEARHHAFQAGLLYQSCNDDEGQAETAVLLGQCNHALWRYREASEALLYALTHARLTRNRKMQSEILVLLSQVLADTRNHPEEALQHAEEAFALSDKPQEMSRCTSSASALGAMCVAHGKMGEHMEAVQCAKQQRDACVSNADVRGKERALCNLGKAQLALGLADEAEQTFQQQREAAVWLGDMASEACALQGLSNALVDLRCYDLALDTIREEEVVLDCIGDFGRRRLCLDRLCKLLEKLKCKSEAMDIRRREGVPLHPLAPLFSREDENQLHFDEDRVIKTPRLCHHENPHPWTLPTLPSQYLMWGNRFHLSSSPGRRVMLNFPAGYIKKDFEPIKKAEPQPPPPPPKKTLNLV